MRRSILHQLQSLLENDDPIAVKSQVQQLKLQYQEAAKQEASSSETVSTDDAPESTEAEGQDETTAAAREEAPTPAPADNATSERETQPAAENAPPIPDATAETENTQTPATEEQEQREVAFQSLTSEEKENPESQPADGEPETSGDELDQLFYSTLNEYRKKLKNAREIKQRQEKENLAIRQDLVESLKELVQNEENIGKAFATFHAIQEKWKSTGPVSNQDYHELNTQYNKYVEQFFYNINIYKELKDYDLKHNLELKKQLIEDQQKVAALNDIKEIEQRVRSNQDRWNEIGPTYKEEWDKIKDAFWTATREAYRKVQNFYDGRREEQKQNFEAKKALLEKVKQLNSLNLKAHKKWQVKTAEVIALQNEWKTIGRVPKSEGNALYKEFRKACDEFFEHKRAHYKKIHEEQDANKELKLALVKKAEALQADTNWADSTRAMIDLQKEWKKIGAAHQRDEKKLWKAFRSACDTYFENKKSHLKQEDTNQAENLRLKEALIEKIEAFEPSDDKKSNMATLQGFIEEWRSIGFVPFKEKNKINQSYNKAINSKINALKISDQEKQKLIFSEKLESLREAPNSERLLIRERDSIMHKISRLQAEINQYENNLGFFQKSKDADKLKREVEKKIERVRDQISVLEAQLRQLTEG